MRFAKPVGLRFQIKPLGGSSRTTIYTYSHMFGRPPAETEMQRHFAVSPLSVHQMIVTLERNGLIHRQAGAPRSIEILVPPENLPILSWLGIKPSKSL
jgi:SOS-response transcriptional repressor LexA